jgi:hypothetical protein
MATQVAVPNENVGPQALRIRRRIRGYDTYPIAPLKPQIVIPQSATVYSMVGLNFELTDYMPAALQGYFADTTKYSLNPLLYPASLAATSITDGQAMIDDAVRNTSGPMIVFCHSQGCQSARRWINANINDPTAPAGNRLTFVFIGDLLRATGGDGIGKKAVDGVIEAAMPTDTPWPIVDIARRWDGWADPNQVDEKWATKNTKSGKAHFHTQYQDVNIFDPANTVWKVQNTTFVLTREDTPPLLGSWILLGDQGIAVKNAFQKHIESKYTNRPTNDAPYTQTVALNSFWITNLTNMGVLP